MSIQITSELEELVEGIMSGGEYRDGAEVLREALHLLRERDQLRADIQAGIHELDRGESVDADEVFRELEEKIAQRKGQDA
jgi:antitoxin ParD1/3/4